MLPKERRLDKKSFTEVFKTGRRIKLACLQCIYMRIDGGKDRFAVVVPKRVVSSKPKANTIRRRFYGALKKSSFKDLSLGIDAIFIIDRECVGLSEAEITCLLNDFYNKIH